MEPRPRPPELQGIVLMSEKDIAQESINTLARNMLQVAFAEHLKFDEQDEASTFETFLSKYGEPIKHLIIHSPEIRDEYAALLAQGKEKEFDFEKLKLALHPYITLH